MACMAALLLDLVNEQRLVAICAAHPIFQGPALTYTDYLKVCCLCIIHKTYLAHTGDRST